MYWMTKMADFLAFTSPEQKGYFFAFINGAMLSDHFELRCQGKSDSDLDI